MAAPALYFDLTTGRNTRFGGINETTLSIDTIAAFTTSATVALFDNITTGTLSIGGSIGAAGALRLGNASGEVEIRGDFRVKGSEIVEGTTSTVNGSLSVLGASTLGDGEILDVLDVNGPVDIDVPSTGTFALNTSGAANAITISSDGAGAIDAITLSTTTSGSIAVNSVATLDMDAGAVVEITGGTGMSLATTANELDITSAAALDLNGTVVTLDGSTSVAVTSVGTLALAGTAVTLDGTSASDFTVTGNTLSLITTGANDVNITPGAGIVDIATTHANQAMALDTTASTSAAGIFVGDAAPSGTPTEGSLWIRTASDSGELYLYNGATHGWNLFTTSAGSTLQAAYVAGNTMTTSAGEGSVVVAGTETLQVTATGGINIDTQLDFDGTVFDVQMTGTNGFSLDATDSANISTTAGNLTIESTDASGDVIINANGATAGVLDLNGRTVDIDAGAGGTAIDGTSFAVGGAGAIPSTFTATTFDVNATGAVTLDSSGGAISIGADAVAQAINVGTGAAARTITVGNTTTTTAVDITSGATGDITFAARASGANSLTYNDVTNVDITGGTYIGSETSIVGALLELDTAIAGAGDTTFTGTAGELLVANDLVAIGADGDVWLADADNAEASKQNPVGICIVGGAAAATVTIAAAGELVVSDLAGGTAGAPVWVSETAGDVTLSVVGYTASVCRVGFITDVGADKIAIHIGDKITL